MKIGFILVGVLFNAVAFANVSLDVDFKDYGNSTVTHFKQNITAGLDEIKTFVLPNSNQEIEILVSEKLPKEIKKMPSMKDSAMIDLKLYEVNQGERKLVNSGKVITNWGKTATMEKFKDDSMKSPLMTLKVVPTKI